MYFEILQDHEKRTSPAIAYFRLWERVQEHFLAPELRYNLGGLEKTWVISDNIQERREYTHDMNSASREPAPRNFEYAEM